MPRSAPERVEAAIRPRIPVALLPAVVRARARLLKRHPAEWAQGQRQMRFLTGVRDPDVDLDALTERYLTLQAWRSELRWHPELMVRQRVEGLEHLRAAQAHGRGVLVCFLHHAFYDCLVGALDAHDVALRAIVTPAMFEDDMKPWMRQQLAVIDAGVRPPLNAAIGKQGIVDLLADGEVVAIAIDVPSSSRTEFLGRQVVGASGLPRIAKACGVPVVMVTYRPDAVGPIPTTVAQLSPALEPADFETPEQMLSAIIEHYEPSVLAWPEAYDEPLRRWTWVDDPDTQPDQTGESGRSAQ